eukprot:124891-Rhodomonas_salina.2
MTNQDQHRSDTGPSGPNTPPTSRFRTIANEIEHDQRENDGMADATPGKKEAGQKEAGNKEAGSKEGVGGETCTCAP